jgi:hypothetical protein
MASDEGSEWMKLRKHVDLLVLKFSLGASGADFASHAFYRQMK